MLILSRAAYLISRFLVYFSVILLAVMMLHITADVLTKWLFNFPIQGTLEFVKFYYMVAVTLLPLALVEAEDRSISVDLFTRLMPQAVYRPRESAVLLLGTAFYSALFWRTLHDALLAYERQEGIVQPIAIAVWPGRFVLPLAFGLAALVCLLRLTHFFMSKREESNPFGIPPDNAVEEGRPGS